MSLRVCCSQVLLVPAVHVPHSAVLHLLWGRLCGHHPQPHGCRHPLWSLLRPHESLCWLCHSPARVPRLVDLGKTIILLFACYHTSLRQRSSVTHSFTHSFVHRFVQSICIANSHMGSFTGLWTLFFLFCAVPELSVMLAFQAAGLGLHSCCSHGCCMCG